MKAVLIQHCFYEHDDQQEPLGKAQTICGIRSGFIEVAAIDFYSH